MTAGNGEQIKSILVALDASPQSLAAHSSWRRAPTLTPSLSTCATQAGWKWMPTEG